MSGRRSMSKRIAYMFMKQSRKHVIEALHGSDVFSEDFYLIESLWVRFFRHILVELVKR